MKFKPLSLKVIVADLKKLPYVEAIILFGSHARGTTRQDSDIDIAVITKGATEEQEYALRGGDDLFDIHPFKQLPLIIQFRVFNEGKILYIRNKNSLHEIKAEVLRKYLAAEPFLEKVALRVLANV